MAVWLVACGGRSELIGPRTSSTPLAIPEARAQLALGHEHSCVLRERGAVFCWGLGTQGQLGAGDAAITGVQRVGGLDDAVAISAGGDTMCALRRSGSVSCWGSVRNGHLGWRVAERVTTPQPVVGLPTMTSIAVGHTFACGLSVDRDVWCWGSTAALVARETDAGAASVEPFLVGSLRGAVTISAAIGQPWGASDACTLDEAGRAWCFGGNGGGRLGVGRLHAAMGASLVPLAVNASVVFTDLVAGGEHTCALDGTHAAWCWGVNGGGRLGDGSTTDRAEPTRVNGLDAVQRIAPGGYHTCALLEDRRVACWGANDRGQVGRGAIDPWGSGVSRPTVVNGLGDVIEVGTGMKHSCAVRADASVWCWGRGVVVNPDGTTSDSNAPIRVAVPE